VGTGILVAKEDLISFAPGIVYSDENNFDLADQGSAGVFSVVEWKAEGG
jgi:hypothetical protein